MIFKNKYNINRRTLGSWGRKIFKSHLRFLKNRKFRRKFPPIRGPISRAYFEISENLQPGIDQALATLIGTSSCLIKLNLHNNRIGAFGGIQARFSASKSCGVRGRENEHAFLKCTNSLRSRRVVVI